jgi:hypothetical protein
VISGNAREKEMVVTSCRKELHTNGCGVYSSKIFAFRFREPLFACGAVTCISPTLSEHVAT